MSQPRQPTPSNSPTPSKSSLRRTSGTRNPSQRSLIPPPSPHFDDQPAVPVRYSPRSPPNQTLDYESDEDDEPLIYPDPPLMSEEESYFPYPEPQHPLQPFFTLIEDGLTSEHHHPSVHYIFADDDTDLITEAALRSLEQDDLGASSTADASTARQNRLEGQASNETRLPAPAEGTREHYLIIDVHPVPQAQIQAQSQSQNAPQSDFLPSYAVASFSSFSPDWQVSSATITAAPTMGDTPGEDEGLMLRIEGKGVPPLDDFDHFGKNPIGQGDERDPSKGRERETLDDMIDRFQSRLGEVRKLIEIDAQHAYRDPGILAADVGDTGYHTGQGIGFGLEEPD